MNQAVTIEEITHYRDLDSFHAKVSSVVERRASRRDWAVPRLIELVDWKEIISCRFEIAFQEDATTNRYKAFVRMAGWKRNLPGFCSRDNPVEAAIQASFWILRLYDEASISGLATPSDTVLDLLRDIHPERKLLQRFLPPRFRAITRDDIAAARLVIQHSQRILFNALRTKQRWYPNRADGSYTPDWTIIKLMLGERLSARDVVARLGLDRSGSDVTRRFKAAIALISERIGPMPIPARSSFPQIGVFVRKVGAVSRPVVGDARREEAVLRFNDLLAKKIWPPISHNWPSEEAARWSAGCFNNGTPYSRSPNLVILIYEYRGWWTTEEELINIAIRAGAIWSGADGAVWRQDELEEPRLDLERLVRVPRGNLTFSTSINSLNLRGPVIEKDGKWWPRDCGSNRIIGAGATASNDTVTRIERAMTRGDESDAPFFPDDTYNANTLTNKE